MDISQVSLNSVGAIQSLPAVAPLRAPDPGTQAAAQAGAQQDNAEARNQAREETRQVSKAVQQLNQAGSAGPTREFRIQLDPRTKRPVVKIVDKQTGEVVQQTPPEYVLRLAEDAKQQARDGAGGQSG